MVDLIVTGASAVTTGGLRFGMGDFYLDIEWAMLRALGAAGSATPVIAVVHDAQVVDLDLAPDASNICADLIITPTRAMRAPARTRPATLDWSIVPEALARTPTLEAFRHRRQAAAAS